MPAAWALFATNPRTCLGNGQKCPLRPLATQSRLSSVDRDPGGYDVGTELPENMGADVERQLREDLARVHDLIFRFNMDELTWNHASVRVPGKPTELMITPGDITFDGVTPENLVIDSANITANVIHSAVYEAREDVHAVIHTHTPAVVTVGSLRCGLRFLCEDAALFHGSVAYYSWEGVSNDEAERVDIMNACKDPNVQTLFMRNHGVCTFGATIQEAFVRAYCIERACRAQLEALKTRLPLREPSLDAVERSAEAWKSSPPGRYEWEPLKTYLDRMSGLVSATPSSVIKEESAKMQTVRYDLAMAHRLSHAYGMDDLIRTRMSARSPDTPEQFLITPGDRMFDDIWPQHLVLNSEGGTGNSVHEAVYAARPDVKAVMQVHSSAVVAVSILESGLGQLIEQDAALFHERVAFHDWEAVSDDASESAAQIKSNVSGTCSVLLMRNRGAYVFGATVAEAWVLSFYLERVCRNYLEAKATGEELVLPADRLLKDTLELVEADFRPGVFEWRPLIAMLDRLGNSRRRRLADVNI